MSILTTDTAVLTRVINTLDDPASFLLDMFFKQEQSEPDVEEIHFDIEKDRPRLTPFVHPTVAGIVVEDEGYETKSFKPAYAKDKRRMVPGDLLKRARGESLTGTLSAGDRQNIKMNQMLTNMLRNLTRREEVMASEALRLGQVTVAGEKYPTVVVTFGRNAALTVTLTSGDLWSATTTATPLDDIEAWVALVHTHGGAAAFTVVMDPVAWGWFRKYQEVKDLLETRRGSSSALETGPLVRGQGNAKARFAGTVGNLDIWVYQDLYEDDAGSSQKVLPDGTVLVGAIGDGASGLGGVEGVRAYGSILDEKAGFSADRFFAKSWVEEDPAVRWVLSQSAPLVVPYRPNASLAASVT